MSFFLNHTFRVGTHELILGGGGGYGISMAQEYSFSKIS